MTNLLNNWFFKLGILFYASIFIGRRIGWHYPDLINSYASDFLFIPILLFLTLWILQKIKKDNSIRISKLQILAAVLYATLLFEYYLPKQNTIYTRDHIDALMYGIGGVVFYYLQKRYLPVINTDK